MKELNGPISDRLREQLDRDDPAWTPERPGDPRSETKLKPGQDGTKLRGRA